MSNSPHHQQYPNYDRTPEVAEVARQSEEFGIGIDGANEADMEPLVDRKDDSIESHENIDYIERHGISVSPHEICVAD